MTRKQLRSFIVAELKRFRIDGEYTVEELNDRINIAKDELSDDVGGFPGYCYGTTTAGISRYELPSQLMNFRRVEFNDNIIDRIYTDSINKFSVPTSGSISWTISTSTGVTATGVTAAGNIHTFADGDTTPSVSGYSYFKTENTVPTAITAFDDLGTNARIITVYIGDDNTSFVHDDTSMDLQGDISLSVSTGDTVQFFYNGSKLIHLKTALD